VGAGRPLDAAPQGWPLESGLTPRYLLRRPVPAVPQSDVRPRGCGLAGLGAFYGRPAVWAGLAIECAAFAGIVRWEEQRLLGRFGGEYRAYLADVPRWVPRFSRVAGAA